MLYNSVSQTSICIPGDLVKQQTLVGQDWVVRLSISNKFQDDIGAGVILWIASL